MNIETQISVGEFLDKITILEIKSERIKDETKLKNISHELEILRDIWKQAGLQHNDFTDLIAQLKSVNEQLWEIEDDIRDKEAAKQFDQRFIELARSVYITNDKRAAIKRDINLAAGSELIEEKSYSDYS